LVEVIQMVNNITYEENGIVEISSFSHIRPRLNIQSNSTNIALLYLQNTTYIHVVCLR